LAFFAAITSSVSLLEPSAAYVAEKFNMTKKKAAWVTGGAITALGLVSLFSPAFFDFIDTGLAGPILAPLSALLLVLFTGSRLKKVIVNEQISGDGESLGNFIMFFVKWIAPAFMGLVLILGTSSRFLPKLGEKLSSNVGLLIMLALAYIALAAFHHFSKND